MSRENRRDERFETRQKLWCEGQAAVEARNMSRSGMFIVSEEVHDVGERLTISFTGDEGEVEVDAQVMWRGEGSEGGKDGLGLRIVGVKKGQEAFDRFVARHVGADDEEITAPGSRAPSGGPKPGPG